MCIALVTDVEDDLINRAVEYLVQGNGKLHNAEIRSKVPAGFGNGIYHHPAYFGTKLVQFIICKLF